MRRLDIARAARLDIDAILNTSRTRHGPMAAARYRRLITLSLRGLRENPERPAAKPAEVGDLRLYALRFSAGALPLGEAVRAPPHVVVFRFDDTSVTILRLLHEAMDLPRHLASLIGPEAP